MSPIIDDSTSFVKVCVAAYLTLLFRNDKIYSVYILQYNKYRIYNYVAFCANKTKGRVAYKLLTSEGENLKKH